MTLSTVNDEEFIDLWRKWGSPSLVARHLKIDPSNVQARRKRINNKFGINLETWNNVGDQRIVLSKADGRIDLSIDNGSIIVFSDAHFWPNIRTTAFRSLLALIKQIKPIAVVCNGDAFDGATVSRWPNSSWMDKQKKPTVVDELHAVKERLGEIEALTKSKLIWPIGNHDARYEAKLAAVAPEFEGVPGFTLKEHFPAWQPCWTIWINGDTRINHFYHSGLHDGHNNLLKGQVNAVTGHTHSLKVTPWTNAKGETLYAVNTGTLANSLDSHNVDYQRGLHGNHRSGFAVLSWRDSKMLMPELVQVWDEDRVEFRGHLLNADTGEVV